MRSELYKQDKLFFIFKFIYMKPMLVSVRTSSNCSHEFIVFADSAFDAIKKVNAQFRAEIKVYKEKSDSDGFNRQHIEYIKDWLNAIRRWKRNYKPRWGGVHYKPIAVYELPETLVYGVSYFQIGVKGSCISNILSEISIMTGESQQEK